MWEWMRQHRSAKGQQRKAHAVDANVNVDISVLQRQHQDVMGKTAGLMSLCWRSDGAMKAGGRRHNESDWSKERYITTTIIQKQR